MVTRDRGKPEFETFFGVPEAEGFVTVRNGAPGLDNLLIVVNGERFRVNGLNDDEQHTLDVSFAMIPGDNNIIEFQALGKPGAHATVVVHD